MPTKNPLREVCPQAYHGPNVLENGGRSGIRTHGPLAKSSAFEADAIDHSTTLPLQCNALITRVLFQHHHSSEPQPGLNGRDLPRPVCVASPRLVAVSRSQNGSRLLRTPDLPGVSSSPKARDGSGHCTTLLEPFGLRPPDSVRGSDTSSFRTPGTDMPPGRRARCSGRLPLQRMPAPGHGRPR